MRKYSETKRLPLHRGDAEDTEEDAEKGKVDMPLGMPSTQVMATAPPVGQTIVFCGLPVVVATPGRADDKKAIVCPTKPLETGYLSERNTHQKENQERMPVRLRFVRVR